MITASNLGVQSTFLEPLVLRVIVRLFLPPNTASRVNAKELNFGLACSQHFLPILL